MAEMTLPRRHQKPWAKLLFLLIAIFSINACFTCLGFHAASAAELEGFGDDVEEDDAEELQVASASKTEDFTLNRAKERREASRSSDASTSRHMHRTPQESEWDDEEFVGAPSDYPFVKPEESKRPHSSKYSQPKPRRTLPPRKPLTPRDFVIEAISLVFLIIYAINYYIGRKKNKEIAIAWLKKFGASEGTIIEKNFSLIGIGDGAKEPLLLKEGQSLFKFYASGRRYCEGMLITLDLRRRHDLLSLIYYLAFSKRDTLTAEVLMNEEAMDAFALAVVKKKQAKSFQRDNPDLKALCTIMELKNRRNFPSEELAVIADSREAANEIISETVVDQVLSEKNAALSDLFVSLHFSDQHTTGNHKKVLKFKFNLPEIKSLNQLSLLMTSIPYFIDSVAKFKLTSAARSRADAIRAKYLEEEIKESQSMKYEAVQKKREEKKKMEEMKKAEIESRLSPEALARKREKERVKELRSSMPKPKISRVH